MEKNFEMREKLADYKRKFNLNNIQLARVLGVSPSTISMWLNKTTPRKKIFIERLEKLFTLDFFKDNVSVVLETGEKKISDTVEGSNLPVDAHVLPEGSNTTEGEKNSSEAVYEPHRWSVSRVKLWLDNPWDFYCRYVKGIEKKSPWQDALDRGTVLHRILELLATSEHDIDFIETHIFTVNEAVRAYNSLLEKNKPIPPHTRVVLIKNIEGAEEKISKKIPIADLSDKGIEDGFRVARKYLDHYETIHNMGKVLEAEKKIEWDMSEYIPNQSFIGFIDAVVQDDRGKIWLVDHKTYSNKPTFENLRLELQANVYMYIMKEVYGVEVEGFIYDCINPKEKIVGRGYHFHQFKIKYNERIVRMVVDNFLMAIEMILQNPDYNMFKVSEYGTPYMDELVHGFDNQKNFMNRVIGLEED